MALAASVPFMYSCEGNDADTLEPKLEIKTNPMAAAKGSQFISVTASGEWNITVTDESGAALDWLTLSPASGTDSKSSVILSVTANTEEDSRSAVLTLNAGAGKSVATLTQKGIGGGDPGEDPGDNPGGDPGLTNAGWMELPAMSKDSDWDFFSHDMTLGAVKTRNYSFSWDYKNLVAPWVAYPLCKWSIGTGSRTNAWGLDPKLPRNKQPVLFKGFSSGNDGWRARGHQIPSADRLTKGCNEMTFYGTNMTPQIQENFNEAIWANLEGKVRSWANKSDTLYVVTGCVTEGSTKYCLDNDGKKITIPTAYYKAVLRYSRSGSTFGYANYAACAVWLDHKEYSSSTVNSTYSLSIDDLEKKLGIDLFANLPAKIGEDNAAKVEAQDPSTVNWWWQ